MKMSELDLLLGEFEQAVNHVQELAKEIRAFFTTKEEPAEEEKPISFTELRALCANKSRAGHTEEIKAMIQDTGANRLSEVEPNRYRELYQRVEALR
jgi:CHASE3 domain sensor protein